MHQWRRNISAARLALLWIRHMANMRYSPRPLWLLQIARICVLEFFPFWRSAKYKYQLPKRWSGYGSRECEYATDGTQGSISSRGKRFFSSPKLQTDSAVYQSNYLMGAGVICLGVKQPGPEADQSPPPTTELRSEQTYAYKRPLCLSDVHMVHFSPYHLPYHSNNSHLFTQCTYKFLSSVTNKQRLFFQTEISSLSSPWSFSEFSEKQEENL